MALESSPSLHVVERLGLISFLDQKAMLGDRIGRVSRCLSVSYKDNTVREGSLVICKATRSYKKMGSLVCSSLRD